MRIGSSTIKHFALACLLTACQFDSKATGSGTAQNSQSGDGSVAGAEAQPGTAGTAAVSGDAAAGVGGEPGQAGEEAPPPLLADGVECNADERCQSGHCDRICCEEGHGCCKRQGDCTPQGGDQGKACDDHENCNGTSGKVTCDSQFRCITLDGVQDDSACDATVKANECGPYKPVYCNGEAAQDVAPPCPTSCSTDDDCDVDAHCDGQCILDSPTGEACDEPGDCESSTCGTNGICCGASQAGGEPVDCCSTARDCPAKYTWAARCDSKATCQGTAGEAECTSGGVCQTKMNEDDSACEGPTDCGLYKPVVCTRGRKDQPERGCPVTCMVDGDCNTELAFCQNSKCVERFDDGHPCDRDSQCKTGCGDNEICCNGEKCCASVADCGEGPGTCGDSCATGKRQRIECAANVCVGRNMVDDDSACEGESFGCGYYKDVTCSAEPEQRNQCLTSCQTNADCDSGNDCSQAGPDNKICVIPSGSSDSDGAGGMAGGGG